MNVVLQFVNLKGSGKTIIIIHTTLQYSDQVIYVQEYLRGLNVNRTSNRKYITQRGDHIGIC